MNKYVAYYVRQLHTHDRDTAYQALLEMDDRDVPYLIEAYHAEINPHVQAVLVEIMGQYHLPETLDFFAEPLQHPGSDVWKNALDGIVAIGTISGDAARGVELLEEEKQRLLTADLKDTALRIEWIDEAIQQLSTK